jgi:DNA-binding transcriptional LysR family regulator
LIRADVDIVIRGGYAANERVLAIKLMGHQFIPVVAPSYLTDMGKPQYAIELKQHKGLYFRTPNGPTPWLSYINGQWQDVSAPQVAVSNNGKWLGDMAAKGKGILMAPRWAAAHHLVSGELVELTLEPQVQISQNKDMAVYLLDQKQRYLVPKVKAAVDFLVARVKH